MGEFSASECSWKKMRIAKSDNEWTSIIKSEPDSSSAVDTMGFSLEHSTFGSMGENDSFDNNKGETDVNSSQCYVDEEDPVQMVQEMDPLLVESRSPRRRRGSGPKQETAEERAARLAKMSAYAAQRLANETPEQRATRLKRMSEYAAKRLARESGEQRAQRLARMSAYAAKRLAKESPEQRQARLSRMSAYAAKRHAMKKIGSPTTSESSSLPSYTQP